MKFVFAIKSLEVRGGGAERVLVNVVNHLANSGHEVHVVTLDYSKTSFYTLDEKVHLVSLALNQPGKSTGVFSLLKFIVKNRSLVKSIRPDFYVGFMHSIFIPAQVSVLGLGVKFVASEHIDISHYQSRRFQKFLVNCLRPFHHSITVPSHVVLKSFPESWKRRARVLANPVEERFFSSTCSISESKRIIVCVGRFMEQKNHTVLLHAFARVNALFPDWRLELYGEGVLKDELIALVDYLRLGESVRFCGYIHSIENAFLGADFSVVPSLYESFGLVAAESLACECPVVAFEDCEGLDEVLTDQNCYRVAASGNRVDNLAEAMVHLIENPELLYQIRQQARNSVSTFKASEVNSRWEDYFLGL